MSHKQRAVERAVERAAQISEAGALLDRALAGDKTAITELYRATSSAITDKFKYMASLLRLDSLIERDAIQVFEHEGGWIAYVNGHSFRVSMPDKLIKQDVLNAIRDAVTMSVLHRCEVQWHVGGEIRRYASLKSGTTLPRAT